MSSEQGPFTIWDNYSSRSPLPPSPQLEKIEKMLARTINSETEMSEIAFE